jgi:CspA family cold shock protein
MKTGVVKWYNSTKGYGFIQPNDGGQDVFVHVTALQEAGIHNLNDGQKVSFDLTTNKGKTSASELKLID